MAGLSALQVMVPVVDPLFTTLRPQLPAGAAVLDPGHISFGYPWLDPAAGRAVIDDVAEALATHRPAEVELHGPERFSPDRNGRVTVYLAPRPAAAVHALADAVVAASGHAIHDYTPHCSLARLPSGADPGPVEDLVAPHLPLRARLASVHFQVQTRAGWVTERTIPIGSAPPR